MRRHLQQWHSPRRDVRVRAVDIVVTQGEEVVVEQGGVPVNSDGSFETTLLLPENLGTDPIRITAPEVAGTETLVLSIRGS